MKTCPKCQIPKSESEYSPSHYRTNRRCRPCQKIYARQHYEANKAAYVAKSQRWRQKQRDWVAAYKRANPCTDCTGFFNPWQMQFDHLGDKELPISLAINKMSQARLKAEMAKCELVCANCHADRTYERSHMPS